MGDDEGTSNGEFTNGGVQVAEIEAASNELDTMSVDDVADGSLGLGVSDSLRTYKRRKRSRSSSESKGQEGGKVSLEAASKMANQTIKELHNHVSENHSAFSGANEVLPRDWRNFVLKQMYNSISDDDGGIQGCLQDALKMTTKDSVTCHEGRHKSFLRTRCVSNGIHNASSEGAGALPNGVVEESHNTVSEMCQHAFLNVILSEEFTSLCKLLFENFEGIKADKLFSLILLNQRMKEGIYGRSPMLFSADIQQLWMKLQGIGTELISLAKSLADVSLTCYNEQVGGVVHCTSEVGKNEFCARESVSHGKPEQMESCCIYRLCTCRNCGDKADGRDCLVCDSCEEMYHISCIKPAVKEIPPKSWYCAHCVESGMGSAHDNCVVCERLSAPKTEFNEAAISPANEETVNEFEETSNYSTDDGIDASEGRKHGLLCKLCACEVGKGERAKRCEHPFCPSKYYHERCLATKQLNSYGPRWYCPSCLCRACLTDKDDDKIVLCDSCDHAYHIYCMNPPRTCIPRGKWFCNRCDVKIQEIQRVKKAYEKFEKKLKKKGEEVKLTYENLKKQLNVEDSDKDKQGMNMLATAALNYEVGCLSNEELKST